MILIDVYVTALSKAYDFGLDDEVQISMVIDEMIEMICQSEQFSIEEGNRQFVLCDRKNKKILPFQSTLRACGIQTGQQLILV